MTTDLNTMSLRVAARFLEAKGKPKYQGKKETEKGNTVYMYSEQQIANRNKKKAERLEKLKGKMGDLRKKVKKDMRSSDPETAMTALAVALIDHTYERVGNEDSAEEGHYGVTGWQRKHLSMGSGKATVSYVGKAGVKHKKDVTDKAILSALRNAYEATEGDDTGIFDNDEVKVTPTKVNAYLKEFDITAKDIRGFHANAILGEFLREQRKKGGELPSDAKKREAKLKKEFKAAAEATAKEIGHESATLVSHYIFPDTEEDYLSDGTIPDF